MHAYLFVFFRKYGILTGMAMKEIRIDGRSDRKFSDQHFLGEVAFSSTKKGSKTLGLAHHPSQTS